MVSYKLYANVNPLDPYCKVLVLNSNTVMCSSNEGQLAIMTRKYEELKRLGYSVTLYKVTEEVVMSEKDISSK